MDVWKQGKSRAGYGTEAGQPERRSSGPQAPALAVGTDTGTHTCTCVHTRHAYTQDMHAHMLIYTQTCIYTGMYVHTIHKSHVYIHRHTCMHNEPQHACTRANMHTGICTCIHTSIHTCTQTRVCTAFPVGTRERFETLLVLVTFNHSRRILYGTALFPGPVSGISCDVRSLEPARRVPGYRQGSRLVTFRGSRGPGSRLGWGQISFLVDFFVLKGHMRERERHKDVFFFS